VKELTNASYTQITTEREDSEYGRTLLRLSI